MFDRLPSGERVILVCASRWGPPEPERVGEFKALALSAGAIILHQFKFYRPQWDAQLLIGQGQAEQIQQIIQAKQAELVLFDQNLSPSQERNLERLLKCRVLDRTGLIMDIFAQRAQSFEGQLQVELAQLKYLSTRLIRGWTHLERQKGGIGLRGPGETQLETDRRLIKKRIDQIQKKLAKVDSRRHQSRRARQKADVPVVALVGYTNAGKSTWFNRLTRSKVYVQDQLFATLDPTLRRLVLPNGQTVILADTVGFIADLPHALVAAFRSTLQETIQSDLLLHVIDASDRHYLEHIHQVKKVLTEIGADQIPCLELLNKIDRIDPDYFPHKKNNRIPCSARTGAGQDTILHAIQDHFKSYYIYKTLYLKATEGRLLALFYRHANRIKQRSLSDGRLELKLCLTAKKWAQLQKKEPELKIRFADKNC